jgi:N-ethylmaleimide reductase
MKDSDPLAQIGYLSEELNAFKLAYLHVMRADFFGLQKADVLIVSRSLRFLKLSALVSQCHRSI